MGEENMVKCKICGLEMLKADGCKVSTVFISGKEYPRIPFGEETEQVYPPDDGERCHDCGTLAGHYHHYGCDWEECPSCHGQLLGCACEDVEFNELEPDTDQFLEVAHRILQEHKTAFEQLSMGGN